MSIRAILSRLKRISEGKTINGTYAKMPIEALEAFKGDLAQVVETCHADRLALAKLEADNRALTSALNGYRAAVAFISADAWDGCTDCINVLKAARNADWLHDLRDPDEIARHLKHIRQHANVPVSRGIPAARRAEMDAGESLDMQTAILMALRHHGVREDTIEALVYGDQREVPRGAIATVALAALNQARLATKEAREVTPAAPEGAVSHQCQQAYVDWDAPELDHTRIASILGTIRSAFYAGWTAHEEQAQ